MPITPTIRRQEESFSFVTDTAARFHRLPVTSAQAVTIYADLEFGAWTTFEIYVRKAAKGSPTARAFSSAKVLTPAAPSVSISTSELEGVDALEFGWSTGAVETAGSSVRITTVAEQSIQATSFNPQATSDPQTDTPPDPSES